MTPAPLATTKSVVKRWLDIAALSITSVLVAFFLGPALVRLSSVVLGVTSGWSRIMLDVLSLVICCWLVLALRHLKALGGCSWQYWLRYPPCWFAAVVGTFVFEALSPAPLHFLEVGSASVAAKLLVMIAAASALTFLYRAWLPERPMTHPSRADSATHSPRPADSPASAGEEGKTTRVLRWIDRDQPVVKADDDLFGLAPISRRISAQLLDHPERSVAIVGPFGSGKTTLKHMIVAQLRRRSGPIVAEVDGWGLSEERAADYVLSRVISALSRHVDCLSLRGLPSSFQHALRAAPAKGAATVGAFFEPHHAVGELLDRIDLILAAINRFLVVFIEDIDRSRRDSQTLSVLAALLDHLKGLSRVSFVLAVGPGAEEIDIPKLCDHVEILPALLPETVRPVVSAFCHACVGKYPDMHLREREVLNTPTVSLAYLGRNSTEELNRSVVSLINTPRLLKAFLRRLQQAWDELHGEIDFDDLLVITAIRTGSPGLFSFLITHATQIRSLQEYGRSEILGKERAEALRTEALASIRSDLSRALSGVEWNSAVAEVLIAYLFPMFEARITTSESGQRAVDEEPTDYWLRAVAEVAGEGGVSDQDFFRGLRDWLSDPATARLSEMLATDGSWARKLASFPRRLPTDQIHSLAAAVSAAALSKYGPDAGFDTVLGLAVLWRIAANFRPTGSLEFAYQQLKSAAGQSLQLALDSEYYWGSYRGSHLLSEREAIILRRAFERLARREYSSAGKLAAALSPRFPIALSRLIQARTLPRPARQWHWMGPILLDAAAAHPTLVSPQLAILVSRDVQDPPSPKTTTRSIVLDKDLMNALWPKPVDQARLMRFLSKAQPPGYGGEWRDYVDATIRAVANLAQKELAKPDSPGRYEGADLGRP